MIPDNNTIIKKLVHHRGLSAKSFSTISEGCFSRSKASGMLLASNNRRYYTAKPGDVEKAVYCLTGLSIPENDIVSHAEELFRALDSEPQEYPPGELRLISALNSVFDLN